MMRWSYTHPLQLRFFLCITMLIVSGCASVGAPVERVNPLRAQGVALSSYTVRKGDTLYSISRAFQVNVSQLRAWNGLNDNLIYPGQVLQIAAPRSTLAPVNNTPPPSVAPPMRSVQRQALRAVATPSVSRPSVAHIQEYCRPSGIWQWPAHGIVQKTYAETTGRMGIDIYAQANQPVRAAAPGQVIYSGSGVNGYLGDLIILRHNPLFLSIYARNHARQVNEGQWVSAGQPLATMGQSPNGPAELHFEISCQDKTLDPTLFLP